MASKRIMSQVNKVIRMVKKESWPLDAAIEAAMTNIAEEISPEEFEELVDIELQKEGKGNVPSLL
jgi:hypothetical protein